MYYQNFFCLSNKINYLKTQISKSLHDLYFFTETWLTCNIESSELCICGYNIYRYDRNSNTSSLSKGGGVLLLYVILLLSQLIRINNNNIEVLFVLITFS